MVLGLGVGELSLAPHLLDQGVIAGEALERPVAKPIGAAVTDVADRHLIGSEIDDRGGDRGPHSGQRRIGARVFVNLAVGQLNCLLQDPLGRCGGKVTLKRLGGSLGGDLARLRPTHPIGDDENRNPHKEGVLVGVSLAPGVGSKCLIAHPQHRPAPSRSPLGMRLKAKLGVANSDHVTVDQLGLACERTVV